MPVFTCESHINLFIILYSPDGCNFVYCSWSECSKCYNLFLKIFYCTFHIFYMYFNCLNFILVHICNIFGDHEVHEALPLFPEERRFCVFALRFSQDGREILGGCV